MSKYLQRTVGEIKPLTGGDALHAPLESLTLPDLVQSFALLEFVMDQVKERKEAIRLLLLEEAEKQGHPDHKGHFQLEVEGSTVTRERRGGKTIDEKKVRNFFKAKGLDLNKIYSKVTVLEMDLDKLQKMVADGIISESEYNSLIEEPSFALKFKANAEIEALLERATKQALAAKIMPKKKPKKRKPLARKSRR